MLSWATVQLALFLLCIFLVIEGSVRALALSFRWLPVIMGVLLIAAGVIGGIALIRGGV